MATLTLTNHVQGHGFGDVLKRLAHKLFVRPMEARAERMHAQIAALEAKTDAELAERGLERSEILDHVMSRYYYA